MKKTIILASISLSINLFSQVGINTPNPKGVFNIDGGKDNPLNGTGHTAAQQLNDFIILPNGNVGIGTITPNQKLEINTGGTSTAPSTGFKLVDGNQGASKVLMSDGNGVGTWLTPASIKPNVAGVYPTTSQTINSSGSGTLYTQSYIDLTQGKWIISAGLTIYNLSATSNRVWLHAYLSSSSSSDTKTGFSFEGPGGNGTSYAGIISNNGSPDSSTADSSLNFINGSSVINVTQPNIRIYLLIQNKTTGLWRYVSNALENYFIATPVN